MSSGLGKVALQKHFDTVKPRDGLLHNVGSQTFLQRYKKLFFIVLKTDKEMTRFERDVKDVRKKMTCLISVGNPFQTNFFLSQIASNGNDTIRRIMK